MASRVRLGFLADRKKPKTKQRKVLAAEDEGTGVPGAAQGRKRKGPADQPLETW